MDSLRGKEILVTGATGFIGSRLAYRLAVEEGATVTGTEVLTEATAVDPAQSGIYGRTKAEGEDFHFVDRQVTWRLLGYRPQVNFEEGMARTELWLRAEGHI